MKKLLSLFLLCASGVMHPLMIINNTDKMIEVMDKNINDSRFFRGRLPAGGKKLDENLGQLKVAVGAQESDEPILIDASKWSAATRKSPFTLIIINADQVKTSLDQDGALAKHYDDKKMALDNEIANEYQTLIERALKSGSESPRAGEEKKKTASKG